MTKFKFLLFVAVLGIATLANADPDAQILPLLNANTKAQILARFDITSRKFCEGKQSCIERERAHRNYFLANFSSFPLNILNHCAKVANPCNETNWNGTNWIGTCGDGTYGSLLGCIKSHLVKSVPKAAGHRGWLGVMIQDITPALAEAFGTVVGKGVLVADVVPGSPAEKNGLRRGDIVEKLNGKQVENANQLARSVAAMKPQSQATIEVIRDGKAESVNLTIGETGLAQNKSAQAIRNAPVGATELTVSQKADLQIMQSYMEEALEKTTVKVQCGRRGLEPGWPICCAMIYPIRASMMTARQIHLIEQLASEVAYHFVDETQNDYEIDAVTSDNMPICSFWYNRNRDHMFSSFALGY
jgi:hypothetical protein